MENELSYKIIEAAMEVHTILGGPGLLESVYEHALAHELSLRDMQIERQVPVPIIYKEVVLKDPMYLDLFVNQRIIVEVKATAKDHPIFATQLLTYLRLTGIN